MTDIFREVEEDYRQEQLLDFWKRHARSLVILLVLILLAAVVLAIYKDWREHQKQDQTATLSSAIEAVQAKTPAEGITALNDAAQKTTGHQRIAARLKMGQLLAQTGDMAGALAAYEAVEKDGSANRAETGLAEISTLELQIDSADPAVLAPQLAKLAGDKSPWRFTARELQGLLAIRQNNTAEAHKIFAALAADSTAPDGIQSRATSLAQLYPETAP